MVGYHHFMEEILIEKRNEIIWSLFTQQDYSIRQIAFIFNISKSNIHLIINQMPEDWKSPWFKKNSK